MTPNDLLTRLADGDPTAWPEIVSRYQDHVIRRARRYHLQEADLLDVVQTTWLRFAEHWPSISSSAAIGGWLATTVSRECLRVLSTGRRCRPEADPSPAVPDRGPGPEQRVVDADAAATVRELVAGLPPRRRELVGALFASDRPSYAELARRSGVPIGSIGPTRARCLTHLRVLAEARGLAPGA